MTRAERQTLERLELCPYIIREEFYTMDNMYKERIAEARRRVAEREAEQERKRRERLEQYAEEHMNKKHYPFEDCPEGKEIPELFTSKWSMYVYDTARDDMALSFGGTYIGDNETEVIEAFKKFGCIIEPICNNQVHIVSPSLQKSRAYWAEHWSKA